MPTLLNILATFVNYFTGESSTVTSSPAAAAAPTSSSGSRRPRRDKSPSDLEADDENDHDSLNQSETGSNLSVNLAGEQQQGTGARRFPEGAASSGAFVQVYGATHKT